MNPIPLIIDTDMAMDDWTGYSLSHEIWRSGPARYHHRRHGGGACLAGDA